MRGGPVPRLLPDLPDGLARLALELSPIPELARRRLHAPRPSLAFQSAYACRDLWRRDADRGRVEDALRQPLFGPVEAFRSADEPFFPALETSGSLRSPFAELSDDFYWLIFMLNGRDPGLAARAVEHRAPVYRGRSVLDLVRLAEGRGAAAWLHRARFGRDWKSWVYGVELDRLLGTPAF